MPASWKEVFIVSNETCCACLSSVSFRKQMQLGPFHLHRSLCAVASFSSHMSISCFPSSFIYSLIFKCGEITVLPYWQDVLISLQFVVTEMLIAWEGKNWKRSIVFSKVAFVIILRNIPCTHIQKSEWMNLMPLDSWAILHEYSILSLGFFCCLNASEMVDLYANMIFNFLQTDLFQTKTLKLNMVDKNLLNWSESHVTVEYIRCNRKGAIRRFSCYLRPLISKPWRLLIGKEISNSM